MFQSVLPVSYNGGGLTVELYWAATSATSGNVVWAVYIERIDVGGLDTDADSFVSQTASAAATSGTSGALTKTSVPFTSGAQMDSLAAGEPFRLKVARLASDGNDTMAGDAELFRVVVRET